jgi:hypothetical protein
MARVQFGSIITDSRGRLGGTVLRSTHYGLTINTLARPRNSQTSRQRSQRARVASISAAWTTTLTDEERADWITLGAANPISDTWGNDYPLTGIAIYMRVNSKRLAAGLSRQDTAPADQSVTAITTATLTTAAGPTLGIAWTATPAPTNHRLKLYVSPPLNPGVTNAAGKLFLILITAAAASSPVDLTSIYEGIFGPLLTGRKIIAQATFFNQANGAESPPVETSVTI